VNGAEHAVRAARSAGASVGDLESLCRRLRRAATDVDRSVSIAQCDSGPTPDGVAATQLTELVTAAGRIRHAAATSLDHLSRPATSHLVDDVRREEAAMAAGVAATGDPFGSFTAPPLPGRPAAAHGAVASR
jgi:hypothetical protein